MRCQSDCYKVDKPLVIVQGTTPVLTLNVDYDLSQGYNVRIAVKTGVNKYFVLINEDLTITQTDCGCAIMCTFTQEQTLTMDKNISIQLRAKNESTNKIIGTLEYEIRVVRVIDKEVI